MFSGMAGAMAVPGRAAGERVRNQDGLHAHASGRRTLGQDSRRGGATATPRPLTSGSPRRLRGGPTTVRRGLPRLALGLDPAEPPLMLTLRRAQERGHFDHGWLQTYHTFSFADYHDPRWMGFRALRVLNEDVVQPRRGFPRHGHRDMEILTWVLDGALAHQDSMGNGSTIRPGDAQIMSAGTGVLHSEQNPSTSEPVHLLQIWLHPERQDLPPRYAQKSFADRRGLFPIAARDERDGAVAIMQDATILVARLARDEAATLPLAAERYAWVQVARGSFRVGDHTLQAGDGAALSGETAVRLHALEDGEALVFDLA
jgi:redox-sensitive bicupin YhaK (pirin superfamily)